MPKAPQPGQTQLPAPRVSFVDTLLQEPWRFDWFQVMRRMEAQNRDFPRLGSALHPVQEPIRVSQKPALAFASSTLTAASVGKQGRLQIEQAAFGLFGPNGPLPLHVTEYVRERLAYDDDRALSAFSDIFHHRFGLLFYRAWASAQPANSLDRPDDDRFAGYIGAVAGYFGHSYQTRDAVPDHAKRYFSGHLVRQTRNPEGLRAILQEQFGCAFRVEEWVPQWLQLAVDEQTRLGEDASAAQLGLGAICGAAVLDRQYRFRLHAGPLTLEQYQAFLPESRANRMLRDWVRNYVGYEFRWDVRLFLERPEAPELRLGSSAQLGWTSWLGEVKSLDSLEALDDLVLEGERESS